MKKGNYETITAIATPIGEGGVGIVRISGSRAMPIAAALFRLKSQRNIRNLPSHTLHYGRVIAGQKVVDEGLIVIMRAPHSYTCEDVIEIQCHGGMVPLQKILRLAIEKGARLAEPGEFTRRAFLNGRLNLAQAEAVADLVRAKTEPAYEIAKEQLFGCFSDSIKGLRKGLLNLMTKVEATIDFPVESGVVLGKSFQRELKRYRASMVEIERGAEAGKIMRQGVSSVIVGRPNVGKSSLMNALLKEKRVIVTSTPGTTKDVIEEIINIQGLAIKIADTAGMRRPRNCIDAEGLKQRQLYLKRADLVILVLDGSQRLKKDDKKVIKGVLQQKKRVIAAINKIDLPQKLNLDAITKFFPASAVVKISAKHLFGLPKFRRKVISILGVQKYLKKIGQKGEENGQKAIIISRLRHQMALKRAINGLTAALASLNKDVSVEFIAFDLQQAIDALGELLGLNYKADILDKVFSQFCIGK